MSGNAAEDAGVLVLHLALDKAAAESAIVGGWRDRLLQGNRGFESRASHAEWTEDFALAKRVERLIGKAFENNAQKDEADVAVFGAASGGTVESRGEGG